ncbi:hypothetical protein D7W81_38045 [Corallococcus aberystwythensis]|uniref:Uncharacterized protein n=1 Tax=Corallococcus aberystwythensis TaxID=2316722 RepID=A0A3A8PLR0_9BACT|nr:hypothetical protein D7W81_38045 [Corallococcus aberystwythensis]
MSDQNPAVSELFAAERWSCATYASLHADSGVRSLLHAPSWSWEAAKPDTGSVSDAELSVDDGDLRDSEPHCDLRAEELDEE